MINVVDLFCGAGGTSTGAYSAASKRGLTLDLTAINHWQTAVDTHTANHPGATHLCVNIDNLNPRHAIPPGELHILLASPECTHHSIARGGKPISDQSRATAWCVVRWAEARRPKIIIVENVKEFLDWGPVDRQGKIIKSRKGEIYQAWANALRSIGYQIHHTILCAADYGDPTTRKRLFIYAIREDIWRAALRQKTITHPESLWPTKTHFQRQERGVHAASPSPNQWIPARDIIDWSVPGKSIFRRKKPLKPKTLNRIFIGLQKYGFGGQPFIVPQQQGGKPVHTVDDPLTTVTTTSRGIGLAQPFLTVLRGTSRTAPLDAPAPALTAGGGHLGLVEPFLVSPSHGNNCATADNCRVRAIEETMPTITSGGKQWSLLHPYITAFDNHGGNGSYTRDINDPLSTIVTKQGHALCNPYLIKYYGTADAIPVTEPLGTVTVNDRFALVIPKLFDLASHSHPDAPLPCVEIDGRPHLLDILFRMLLERELAAAQGFPSDYKFTGTKTDIVAQIGNAVPTHLAAALVNRALDILAFPA
jgi:DNA (cytosine-5)-methyltransferase 1